MVRLTIRIDFDSGDALGPGKVRLLEQVQQTGSIRQAAAGLKMSYRRAWLLIQATEAIFGAPLIETATGGRKGGGASLTALGKSVVKHYRELERKAHTATKGQASALAHSRHAGQKKQQKTREKAVR